MLCFRVVDRPCLYSKLIFYHLQDYLAEDPQLLNLLNLKECIQRPLNSFIRAVLEPLQALRARGKIENQDVIIIVDSLNDAEYHKPDHGDTITSFIEKILPHAPSWIKWIVTVKSSHQEIIQGLPLTVFDLWPQVTKGGAANNDTAAEHQQQMHNTDVLEYVTYRSHISNELKANICVGCNAPDPSLQRKFFQHLVSQSKGNFLYCKLVLDLIENGNLVLKTANFKILPVNLHEVLLLQFNLKFPR